MSRLPSGLDERSLRRSHRIECICCCGSHPRDSRRSSMPAQTCFRFRMEHGGGRGWTRVKLAAVGFEQLVQVVSDAWRFLPAKGPPEA